MSGIYTTPDGQKVHGDGKPVGQPKAKSELSPAHGSAAMVDSMKLDTSRTRTRWESFARWPAGVMGQKEQNTMDEHDTEAQAQAVCQMLNRDGFGGDGTVFPIATWVLPPNE